MALLACLKARGRQSSKLARFETYAAQLCLRRRIVCRDGGRSGIEAPEWSGGACVNVVGVAWVLSMGRSSGRRKSPALICMSPRRATVPVCSVSLPLLVGAACAQWAHRCALHVLCWPRCPTRPPSNSQLSTARALLVYIWAPVTLARQQRSRAARPIGAARGTTRTGSLCLGQGC